MRFLRPIPRQLAAMTATTLALLIAGAFPLAAADKKAATEQSIGDVAEPTGGPEILVEGVGLVIGLQNTGSDPTPSWYREKLLGELKRNPNIDADAILASPKTSLVIVRGVLPAGVGTKDLWDVEVTLPTGSTTTSLEGGFLMETELSLVGIASEGPLEGKPLAKAFGPILTGSAKDASDLKSGRVLGGGKAKQARPYILYIEERHQSGRMAKRLEDLVNFRFHERGVGGQTGMAVAKTDKHLELNVPKVYHQNQLRYLQVIKSIRLTDSPDLYQQRLDEWGKELLDPKTAGAAAIRLESLGKNAVNTLIKGLESPNPQVRFFAAESLAYLDDPSGVEVLAETVENHSEFRAFALAALAATDQSAAYVRLRDLMSNPDPEIRYGAFNALRTSDPLNPALGHVRVLNLVPPPGVEDSMAMQSSAFSPIPSRAPEVPDDPFDLYVVECGGPPMVHVTHSRRCEIVVFGRNLEILPPVVLGGTGPILLNATTHDDKIQITRIESSQKDLIEQTVNSPRDLVSLIRTLAQLGATYPDVIAILEAAQKQQNLSGPLLADSLPVPGEKYDEAQILGEDVTKADPSVKAAGYEDDAKADSKPAPNSRRFSLLKRFRDRMSRDKADKETGSDSRD